MGKLGKALGGAGAGAASGAAIGGPWGAAIGGAAGIISSLIGGMNAKDQLQQQQKLNEQAAKLNYTYNEKAADNAFGRTMQMYDRQFADNTPDAQAKRLKEAGLSVGLMYGNAGSTGGANVGAMAQGSGSSGAAQAGQAANETERTNSRVAQMGMALQLAKMKSEVAVNESIAEKNKVDAKKTAGVDTELTKTQITSLTEQTENIKVQRAGQELQNRIDAVKANVEEGTETEQIHAIGAAYDLLEEQVTEAVRNNEIGEETKEIIKQTTLQNLKNLAVDEVQKWANVTLTKRQTIEIGQWIDLEINKGRAKGIEIAIELTKMGLDTKNKNLDRTVRLIEAVLGTAAKVAGAGMLSTPRQQTTNERTVETYVDGIGKITSSRRNTKN